MIYEILKVTERRFSLRRGYTPQAVRSVDIIEAPSFAEALRVARERGVIHSPGVLHFRSTTESFCAGEVLP